MNEHDLMNNIMLAVSSAGHKIFRTNVGKVKLSDGRWFDTGLPKGYSDLSGCRGDDGKAIFIEVKTPTGKLSEQQCYFLLAMLGSGANAGIARSTDDALRICDMTEEYRQEMRGLINGDLERFRGSSKRSTGRL